MYGTAGSGRSEGMWKEQYLAVLIWNEENREGGDNGGGGECVTGGSKSEKSDEAGGIGVWGQSGSLLMPLCVPVFIIIKYLHNFLLRLKAAYKYNIKNSTQ